MVGAYPEDEITTTDDLDESYVVLDQPPHGRRRIEQLTRIDGIIRSASPPPGNRGRRETSMSSAAPASDTLIGLPKAAEGHDLKET